MSGDALRIVVASGNPAKKRAALNGFRRMFPGREIELATASVPSGVEDQPLTGEATLRGARNRARAAAARVPAADFWVGMEGGVEEHESGLASYAWVVVLSRELEGNGRTGTFILPERVAALVRQGLELSAAIDAVLGPLESGHTEGAVGRLTHGAMDRVELYEHGVVLALVPFRNPEAYGRTADV